MLRSLQWVVITSITIHIEWNLYFTVPPRTSHYFHYHPYAVACQLNGPSNGWSPSIYSGTSTERSIQWVVTTSITIHIQWHVNWMAPPMGGHHLHYHPYTVEPLLNSPFNGWSPPPLPSIYSGTSTLWSLQWVVITSITIHTQWNLYIMVPPMDGHHLHYHPYTVEPLCYGRSTE